MFDQINTEVMRESAKTENQILLSELLSLRGDIIKKVKNVLVVYGSLHPELKERELESLAKSCHVANTYMKDMRRNHTYTLYENNQDTTDIPANANETEVSLNLVVLEENVEDIQAEKSRMI